MKIELGKRYVRRDGEVTEDIEFVKWPFKDPKSGETYTVNGLSSTYDDKSESDLIEEYVKPVEVELWAVVNTGRVLTTSLYKSLLEQDYPGLKIIKLREVTDEV